MAELVRELLERSVHPKDSSATVTNEKKSDAPSSPVGCKPTDDFHKFQNDFDENHTCVYCNNAMAVMDNVHGVFEGKNVKGGRHGVV